jgi:hypothetical protein
MNMRLLVPLLLLTGCGGPSTTFLQPYGVIKSPDDDGSFASAATGVGDLNGDGFDDLAVGSPYVSGEGELFGYYGGTEPFDSDWDWHLSIDLEIVGSPGDVNGDGLADLLVEKRRMDRRATVIPWTDDGPAPIADWWIRNTDPEGLLGIGDNNGDGYDDAVIQGGPELLLGSSDGLTQAGPSIGDDPLGVPQRLEDVNGDGRLDFLTASWDYDVGEWTVVEYLSDGPDFVPGTPLIQWDGEAFQAGGDVDGDGFADVCRCLGGDLAVHRGSATGVEAEPSWTVSLTAACWNAIGIGDVDADGFDEIAVSGFAPEDGSMLEVFRGGTDGPSLAWSVVAAGGQYLGNFGFETEYAAGDVNGDGYADLLVPVDSWGGGGPRARVCVYAGGPFEDEVITATCRLR